MEQDGKSFARTMEFATDGIGGLFSQDSNFFVTEFLVSYEQEQQPIFTRQAVESFLYALTQLFRLQDMERGIGACDSIFPDCVIGIGKHVSLVPGLLQVATMIDGDAVKPSAPGGVAPKIGHFAKGFEKNIMSGILGLLRITQKPQSQIINSSTVLLVDGGKFGVRQRSLQRLLGSGFNLRFTHNCVHWLLDRGASEMSRQNAGKENEVTEVEITTYSPIAFNVGGRTPLQFGSRNGGFESAWT
jgi:hypothetical protein